MYLDLGTVKNLARVRLNGRDLGVAWCAPWRREITEVVKPTDNRLEISVANLWPNRLIGDQSLPTAQRLAWTTWNPFRKTPAAGVGAAGAGDTGDGTGPGLAANPRGPILRTQAATRRLLPGSTGGTPAPLPLPMMPLTGW